MKKILLSAVTLFAAIGVNAQEVGQVDVSSSFTSGGTSVSAGTEVVSTTSITMAVGGEDTYKSTSASAGGITTISFDGNTISGATAIAGSANPQDDQGSGPAVNLGAPISGAYYTFDVADGIDEGYLYVVVKVSSNKSLLVFEEGECIGYTLAVANDPSASSTLGSETSYTYTIDNDYYPSEDIGYVTTANKYYNANGGLMWPEKIIGGCTSETDLSSWTAIGASGMGYLVFPVYGGLQYKVTASGSKATVAGFYFSTTEATSIVGLDSTGAEYVTFVGSTTGINSVPVAADVDAASSKAAVKSIENGKIVITKDGKKYNVAGAQIQ